MWKHYIVLFGGFYDPGVRSMYIVAQRHASSTHPGHAANYLSDLWVFDTQEYKWKQIEFRENERKPSCVRYSSIKLFLDLIQRLDLVVDSPSLLRRMVSFFMVSMRVCSIAPIVLPLHVGGYCKEYVKGSRPVGVMLEDTWFLRCVVSILTHDARGIQSE